MFLIKDPVLNQYRPPLRPVVLAVASASLWVATACAAPLVSRLTPPSELFSSGQAAPVIARFLPGQRFDLQATLRPDDATRTITSARFSIDGKLVDGSVALRHCSTGIPVNAAIATMRAVTVAKQGMHTFSVSGTQSDGQTVTATGNFEVVPLVVGGQKIKNIIIMLGDGMGAAHRGAHRCRRLCAGQGDHTAGNGHFSRHRHGQDRVAQFRCYRLGAWHDRLCLGQ